MDHICCIKCDKMYLDILSKGGIRLLMNEYGSVTTSHFDGNVSLFNIMIGPMHEFVIIYGMNVNSTFHIDEFFSPSFKIAPIHDPTNVCNHIAFDGRDILCCDGCSHALHIKCDPLPRILHDTWYCRYCQNVFQKEDFVEHLAIAIATRSKFVDPVRDSAHFLKLWVVAKCLEVVGVFNLQDALEYWVRASFSS